jgi:UrcA family protein
VAGAGEAAKRRSRFLGLSRMHHPKPKEITMFRTFTAAAILALTITAAQAESPVTVHFGDLDLSKTGSGQILAQRVHAAAESTCVSTISAPGIRRLYYRELHDACVLRTSQETIGHIQVLAAQSSRLASK